jgi:DNA-binding transcriptional regulator GbsR (MarR family)
VQNATVQAYANSVRGGVEVFSDETWIGGGPLSALRLYRAHHPDARIYDVTYRGRTVWMTLKQFAIWREALKYYKRGKRTTLEQIAKTVGCSKSTVSRFLTRLDLWRFIDYVTLLGRTGGTYIFTRKDIFSEADANESGARITQAARKKARYRLAMSVKRRILEELRPVLAQYKLPPLKPDLQHHFAPIEEWVQQTFNFGKLGRTGGTFKEGH